MSIHSESVGLSTKAAKSHFLRDGYISSVREGCFGSDFVALFSTKGISQQDRIRRTVTANDVGVYEVVNGMMHTVTPNGDFLPFNSVYSLDRKMLTLTSLYVTENWLSHDIERAKFIHRSRQQGSSAIGDIYCKTKWQILQSKFKAKGIDIDRSGYTEKTLFYLRKYIFSEKNPPVNSLIHSLKIVMYIWADKLSYFLDHDFKNKMKQEEIVSKMHFDPPTMKSLLERLRITAVERFLENPVGAKYLQVTGYSENMSDFESIFAHLSRPEVNMTRSKTYHDSVANCMSVEAFDIFN
ncbi:hypothetical protein HDU82_006424 [Entophlyctis luteolus]|nr:hypothetical protein HDU82_006424 [Entophlyctis luteolus]